MSLGPLEVMVILVIALLLFGPDRLPEMGRSVAKGLKELRKLQDSVKADIDQVMTEAGLKEETAPTYRSRPPAYDDNHDHESAEPFPVDPDAPTATNGHEPSSPADDSNADPFPVDTGYAEETQAPTGSSAASASSSNGRPVPKPRTGPLDATPEIVDISDGFPPPGSFS